MADATTYSLEQFVDELLECAEYEHGEPFDDLRLTKVELAKVCAEAVDRIGCLECIWCGVDTGETGEYYMVTDHLWRRHGPAHGCLCIGCLENRLGRQLRPADFKKVPLNADLQRHRSDRLRNRLGLDHPALFDADALQKVT